jgi:hypothetical protein
MIKSYRRWLAVLVPFAALSLGLTLLRPSRSNAAPPQQYPIMDKVADKIILKYQQSSCQQLQQKESQKAPPSPQEIKAVEFLHNDAQMRAAFINKVAAPIANKLFECGMIP